MNELTKSHLQKMDHNLILCLFLRTNSNFVTQGQNITLDFLNE